MRKRPLCIVCIGLMIAIWVCRMAGIPVFGEPFLTAEEENRITEGCQVTLTGAVTERRISSESVRYTLRHVRVTVCDRQIPFSGVFVSTEYRSGMYTAEPGDLIRARGELRPLEKAGNPGQFDAAGYYACQKICYRLWADEPPEVQVRQSVRKWLSRLRESLTETYSVSMHEGPAGVLSAMLLGDKAFLTEESRRNFQAGGCLHLLVISGLHVMLLGMGLLQILLRLRVPQTPACMIASAVMVIYTAMTGFPVAAVRACIMFLILVTARVMRLSYDSACAMALAAILILIKDPGYLFHAGFQLSFAAAGAASLVTPVLKRFLEDVFCGGSEAGREEEPGREKKEEKEEKAGEIRELIRNISRSVKENTVLWSAVQLCTMPLTAFYFYEIPAWSLPLNLLLVPCVQYVLGAGVIGSIACLFFPKAGRWLLFPADLGLGLFDRILSLSRILPGSSIVCGKPALWQMSVYYAALGAVLWILQKTKKKRRNGMEENRMPEVLRKTGGCAALLTAACIILFFRSRPSFSLTMLDVGQGDCIAVQTGRTVFLSDGGSTSVQNVGKYRILPYLESRAVGYVDAVCISHNDADHMNGIEEILLLIAERQTALRIGCVYMPGWMAQTEDGRRIAAEAEAAGAEAGVLEQGDVFSAGALSMEVLHPFRDGRGAQTGNAGSAVLQVTYRGFTTLLTGDLEKEGEEELLPYLTDIDCLKAGHHGSRWSSSAEFLEVTRPEIALISAPKKSMYGHPHQEALDRLEEAGAAIFATKDCGAVEIEVNRAGDTRMMYQAFGDDINRIILYE